MNFVSLPLPVPRERKLVPNVMRFFFTHPCFLVIKWLLYTETPTNSDGGPHNDYWQWFTYGFLPCEFADLAFFQGEIYVLATNCLIYQVSVQRCGIILFPMEVKYAPRVSGFNLQLVSSNKRLSMVYCYSEEREVSVDEVDFDNMAWVRTLDLGEEAIFVSDAKVLFCG